MSWFICALVATFGWGLADLFYKKGTDEGDRFSHLKIAVQVGIVMGLVSLVIVVFVLPEFSFSSFVSNAVKYLPASLSYIISMVIGYAGLRYLEVSIISPVQNASGAFSMIVMLVFFLVKGTITSFFDEFSTLDVIGSVCIIIGVIVLAIIQNKLSSDGEKVGKKYKYGALALIFPLLYCTFDTIGTAFDGIILNEETGLGLGEMEVLVLYGFTFLLAGIGCYIFMLIRGEVYNPFAVRELKTKTLAAVFEEFGQIFYVYAMAANPMLAAPMISSYCIISVILSRLFIKEKLTKGQYVCIIIVIVGIVLLGISEGLSEGA